MTLTLTTENVYLAVIAILMLVQVFQWRLIFRLRDSIKLLWTQIHVLTLNVSAELLALKSKQDEQKKS